MPRMTRAAWVQFHKAWKNNRRRLTDDEYRQLCANWQNWDKWVSPSLTRQKPLP